jgi:uncharacterized membrane protein YheB (UPF0754 family)
VSLPELLFKFIKKRKFIDMFFQEYGAIIGLILMPFTYSFAGWFTNFVAIKMTFYPLVFWGIPPYLGWQGIIPRKSKKMAGTAVDIITKRLFKIEEMFDNIDPMRVEKELRPTIEGIINEHIKAIIDTINPIIWTLLPQIAKNEILETAKAQSPVAVRKVVEEIQANVNEIFDVKELVLANLTGKNVKRLVEMFKRVGGNEFRIVELAGLYLGFLLGLIQLGIWSLISGFSWSIWTLPVQGALVGYLTNWIAIKMIFRPLVPTKYGPFTHHGIFIKRQPEVAKEYAAIVANEILTPRQVLEQIFYGKAAEKIFYTIRKVTATEIDKFAGITKPILFFNNNIQLLEKIKQDVVEKMTSPESISDVEDYLHEAMQVESTIAEKMAALPPEEFEVILRTAFEEDEWILIAVGGVLGALVGLGQMFYMMAF